MGGPVARNGEIDDISSREARAIAAVGVVAAHTGRARGFSEESLCLVVIHEVEFQQTILRMLFVRIARISLSGRQHSFMAQASATGSMRVTVRPRLEYVVEWSRENLPQEKG